MASEPSEGRYTSANHRKYTSGSRIYNWHLGKVFRTVETLVAKSEAQTLLDAGCGEGFAIDFLSGYFPDLRMTGVDVSEAAVAFAREHFGDRARFRTGSLYKLPFSDRAFDTVLCSEVLEHLEDPSAAIEELKRVARNYVIITVPLEPYFEWLNLVARKLSLSIDPGHVNFWTKQGFMTFMRHHFDEPEFSWRHIYQFMIARV